MVGGGRVDLASALPHVLALREAGATFVRVTSSGLVVAFGVPVSVAPDASAPPPVEPGDDEDDEQIVYGSADG